MSIDGIEIHVHGNVVIPEEEQKEYVKRGLDKYGDRLKALELKVCEDNEDEVDIEYFFRSIHFNRLRRITGYLVGSMERWNDGKRAEEADRVKHGV